MVSEEEPESERDHPGRAVDASSSRDPSFSESVADEIGALDSMRHALRDSASKDAASDVATPRDATSRDTGPEGSDSKVGTPEGATSNATESAERKSKEGPSSDP